MTTCFAVSVSLASNYTDQCHQTLTPVVNLEIIENSLLPTLERLDG